jgi:non-specific serine/threonine protein kinase/serine/threonine-protein kinase
MGEIERTIREVEPPRPSARASDPSLAGELDWIVMRCLEKERSRRYATPAEIAADIQRLLRHEPVTARPPSSAYRLRKFARRNRLVLSAGALLAIALFAGATVSTLGFMQAARQRDDAEHRGKISAGVVGYVTNELLRQADPSVSGGHDITVKDVLKNADATIAEQFHDEPLVEAGIRLTVGEMERTLSDYALAEKHLQRAVDLCMASLGPDHADTVTAQRELAVMYDDQGRNEQAADLFAIVLQKRTALFGERDSRTLQAAGDLAIAYTNSGRYADAERLLLRIFEARLAAGGPDDVSTLLVENNLAVNLWYQGRYDEAFTHAQHAYDGYRAKKGPDHRVSLAAANSLGIIELRRGNLSHAHALLLENLDRRRRVLGNDSPDVASSLSNLAECLLEEDAPANAVAAEVMLRESLALRQRQLPAGHWTISNVKSLLGQALASQQHFSEAQPLLLAGYEGLMSSSQTPPGRAQRAAARLAHCFRAMGDASLSEQWEAKAAADRH